MVHPDLAVLPLLRGAALTGRYTSSHQSDVVDVVFFSLWDSPQLDQGYTASYKSDDVVFFYRTVPSWTRDREIYILPVINRMMFSSIGQSPVGPGIGRSIYFQSSIG